MRSTHTMNAVQPSKEGGSYNFMDESQDTVLSRRSQSQKDKSCDSTYKNQVLEWNFPEAKGMGICCLVGTEFWFCKMRRTLWMDGGGGHIIEQICLKLLNYALKMI